MGVNAMKAGTHDRAARVLIVDDHPAVREGLGVWIARQPDLELCGEAAEVAQALALFDEASPDVVVVDLSLKGGDGIDLIKRILRRRPRPDPRLVDVPRDALRRAGPAPGPWAISTSRSPPGRSSRRSGACSPARCT